MDNNKVKPIAYMSANSKNLRNFQAKQKFKLLFSGMVIIAPLAIGGLWYVNRNGENESSSIPIAISDPSSGIIDDSQLIDQTVAQESNDGSVAQTVPSAPSNQGVPSGSTSNSASDLGGLPAGVTTAVNSIESSGIKGNPYVASSIDTTMLPEGTTVSFNRSSWNSSESGSGTMAASLSASGQVFNGVITFSSIGGSWKATGYSIQ